MPSESVVSFGRYQLMPTRRLLLKDESVVEIGSRALDVLIALVEAAGEVVSHPELAARAWPNTSVGEGSLRVTVAGLRKALGEGEDGGRFIANVTGRGYCFVAPVTLSKVETPSAPRPPSAAVHKLPPRLTRIVGRDDAIEALSALVLSHRFVSVIGTGGMGKTTVAVFVGHRLCQGFDGGAYFVDLGAVIDPALVPSAAAAVLGVVLQAQDEVSDLVAFLADRRVLLILDNCEHVVEAAALMTERLYSQAPQVHILTTSREALRAEGEHVHFLSPLDYPRAGEPPTAAEALATSSVQLFMERAFASGYTEALTDEDAPAVAAICSRLDGIAYAIELAASRASAYGLQGTAELLGNRFKLLWQGRRSAPPRQQTLTAMLDWSVNLLAARDARVLVRLSIFVGVFTLDAALAIASDAQTTAMEVADAVASLIDKSLVLTVPIGGVLYHKLLDPTIDYAAQKLAQSPEFGEVARRHAHYFADALSDGAAQGIVGAAPALATTDLYIGNVRAALEWSFSSAGDGAIGVRLAAGAAPLFFGLSSLLEARRWCEQGLARLSPGGADERRRLVLQSTLAASSMFKIGNGEEILRSLEHCLELAQRLGEVQQEMHLLAGLSMALARTGDFKGAVRVGLQSLEVARRIGSQSAIAVAECSVGVAYHLAGDQAAGRLHLERGVAEAEGLDTAQVVYFGYDHRIRALIALARCLWLSGSCDGAVKAARLAVDHATPRNHPVDLCIALIYAATVYIWREEYDEAGPIIERLSQLAARHSLAPYQVVGLALSGELALAGGEPLAGVQILRRALGDMQALNYHTLTAAFHRALAEGLLRLGQGEEAASVIEKAVARAEALGEPLDLPELLRVRGEICLGSVPPDPASAEAAFQQAIGQARAQSALSLELRSAISLARLWSDRGDAAAAADLLSDVRRRFTEGVTTPDLLRADQLLRDFAPA